MNKVANLLEACRHLRLILVRFAPHVRGERWLLWGALAAMLGEVILRLLEPWPLKYVFDVVIGKNGTVRSATESISPTTLLVLAAAAVVTLALLRAAAAYISTIALALAGNRVLTACRGELFSHLQRLSLAYHAKARTGDLITRLITDIGRLQDVAVTAAMPLVAHSLTLLGMIGVMFWLDWRLALIAVAIFPVFVLSSARLGTRIRAAAKQQRQREGQMAADAAETMAAMKMVQAYGLEENQQEAFQQQNRASLREGVKGQRLSARLERTVDVLVAIVSAGVLWYGSRLVLEGEITPGDLIVFLAYLKNAFKPMRDIAKFTGRIAKAAASADRILDVLEVRPDIIDHRGAIEAPESVGELRFEHVTFSYEPHSCVLEEVSFRACPGQTIAIVGPSGAGKSTIASLALRLIEPQAGRVTLNGIDIRDLKLRSLRARFATVLQETTLFGASARENLAYGRKGATDAQIERAARLAGAHDFIMALPNGYDSVIAERGQTLSGGQRQRIALARAALRDAPILILDEPTTGLDRENERLVADALDRVGRGRITILITHDLRCVMKADEILYLQHGRVIERGTHNDLVERGGSYAAMYRLQSAANDDERSNAHALAG